MKKDGFHASEHTTIAKISLMVAEHHLAKTTQLHEQNHENQAEFKFYSRKGDVPQTSTSTALGWFTCSTVGKDSTTVCWEWSPHICTMASWAWPQQMGKPHNDSELCPKLLKSYPGTLWQQPHLQYLEKLLVASWAIQHSVKWNNSSCHSLVGSTKVSHYTCEPTGPSPGFQWK